eukprot:388939_1
MAALLMQTSQSEGATFNDFNPPRLVEIPFSNIGNQRASDIIAIAPANEKDWATIKQMKRSKWGYTYFAPLKTDPNAITSCIDKNTTWANTTEQWGNVKTVDYSDKVKQMDDGQYEIRYYQCSGTWKWRRTLRAVSIINGIPHEFESL